MAFRIRRRWCATECSLSLRSARETRRIADPLVEPRSVLHEQELDSFGPSIHRFAQVRCDERPARDGRSSMASGFQAPATYNYLRGSQAPGRKLRNVIRPLPTGSVSGRMGRTVTPPTGGGPSRQPPGSFVQCNPPPATNRGGPRRVTSRAACRSGSALGERRAHEARGAESPRRSGPRLGRRSAPRGSSSARRKPGARDAHESRP